MSDSTLRQGRLAAWATVIVVCGLWVVWSPPGANDLRAGDEGYYGTLARNILVDPAQLLAPALTPLGPLGDKPPLYGALLAFSVRLLGVTEGALRWPSLLSAAAIALLLAAFLRRSGVRWAVWLAPLVLVTLPWYSDASRSATPDIPLTVAGLGALLVMAAGPPTLARALAAGALLGLAFELKLWLAGWFALPALAMGWHAQRNGVRALGLLIATALLVGALHLLAVAWLRPDDLAHWWSIYWQRFVVERVAGAGGALAAVRPPAYYWLTLAHAFVLALPLVGMGFEWAWRERRSPLPRALLVWATGVLGLSLFAVKSGIYLYALVPAWAGLAACGAAALASGRRPGIVVALFAIGSLPWAAHRLGGPAAPAPVWALVWAGFGVVTALAIARPSWAPRLALTLALGAAAGGLAREATRLPARYHDHGFREIAVAVTPWLATAPPQRRSFLAPEAPAFSYYLFRTGDYWGTAMRPWSAARHAEIAADRDLRVFVVDPAAELYGGWPDSTTLDWLERETREITAQIRTAAGRPLRVFVRDLDPPR